MPYIVEIRVEQADLSKTMSAIREWLDARHFEPDVFQFSSVDHRVTFRLEFKIQSQAAACAPAFGGHVVDIK